MPLFTGAGLIKILNISLIFSAFLTIIFQLLFKSQTPIFAAHKKFRKPYHFMQLKGLVRFFAIALIIICLYQLSFTWMVRSHESSMAERAAAWVKANYSSAETKYPGNKELYALLILTFLPSTWVRRFYERVKGIA